MLQLTLWINEKMLTAQDTSYDEARNLHSKWLKHQAFMAELASNKGWLDKVDQVGNAVYVCQLILFVKKRYKNTLTKSYLFSSNWPLMITNLRHG